MDVNQMKLMALMSRVFGGNVAPRQIGGGVQRAQARLAEKRKANAKLYKGLPERPPSRQVRRQQARLQAKADRAVRKAAAMREGRSGGAAVVS